MILNFFKELGEAKQKIVDAENRLAEERLAVVEERRQLEEEKQKFAIERAEKAGFFNISSYTSFICIRYKLYRITRSPV